MEGHWRGWFRVLIRCLDRSASIQVNHIDPGVYIASKVCIIIILVFRAINTTLKMPLGYRCPSLMLVCNLST